MIKARERYLGKVTSKGQTTVPKEVRDFLGLEEGTQVEWTMDDNGKATVKPGKLKAVAGMLGKPPNGRQNDRGYERRHRRKVRADHKAVISVGTNVLARLFVMDDVRQHETAKAFLHSERPKIPCLCRHCCRRAGLAPRESV